ncbi:hypothetical protein LPB68_08065 [Paenibacillus crassostreae]|nr:hypothetical protein LPB68_08065 [Paenibacillus crassostreae]
MNDEKWNAVSESVAATRRRLQLFRVIKYGGHGWICGLLLGLILLLAARIWSIENSIYWAIGIVGLGVIAGFMSGLLHRITTINAASIMDGSTLGNERSDMLVTALSFKDMDNVAVHWQRNQAAKYGTQFISNMRTLLPWPNQRKLWIICASMFMVVLIIAVLPNPQHKVLADAKQQEEWIKTQEKQIDELAKKLQTSKLASITKRPLQDQIEQLQKELDGQKDPNQALDQLEKKMKAMEELAKKQELKEKSLAEMAEKMRQVSQLSSLAKSLLNHSKDELQKAMSNLKNEMQKLSSAEKEKLRESLNKLEKEVPMNAENKQLKDALKQLEEALEKGDSTEQEQALQKLAEELSLAIEAKLQALEQSEAASVLSAALAQQGLGLADQMAAAGLAYSDTWSSGGSAEMLAQAGATGSASTGEPSAGQGETAGQGSTPGTGTGQGSGNGQGSGSGSGGKGTGTGSGTGSGAGLGIGGRELVTTPRLMEGKDGLQSDGGPIQGGGGDIQKGGDSQMIDGASRPYEEVYEEYAAEAKKSIGRNDLPQKMQGLVESYFTSINPNF